MTAQVIPFPDEHTRDLLRSFRLIHPGMTADELRCRIREARARKHADDLHALIVPLRGNAS